MAKFEDLIAIDRFNDDVKEGDVIRRTGDTAEMYTPNGIEKGEDYRIDRIIRGEEYRLTRLSNGEKISTFLNGNEHRYHIVRKARKPAPVNSSETLRTIKHIDEMTPGSIIRRTDPDTDCAPRGVKYRHDYRVVSNNSGMPVELLCLTTGERIRATITSSCIRYSIVEQPAQEVTEPESPSELDRFERIYRTLLANGIDSVKSVRSALEIVRMK